MKKIIENLQALIDSVNFAETEHSANYVITEPYKKLLNEALNEALQIRNVSGSVCIHCKGSGAVKVGEYEYQDCPCVKEQIVNDANRVLAPVFDFQKGDVVEFCGEHYFIIENNGSTGVVNPFGAKFYIRNFYWKYQDEITKFVRKPTSEELERLDLKWALTTK